MKNILNRDVQWKERSPEETVEIIQKILKKREILTEEVWMEPVFENCYSMRLQIAGTGVGQNGKGVTKSLARASGYAEFMERYLLGKLYEGRREKELQDKQSRTLSFLKVDSLDDFRKKKEELSVWKITRRECQAFYATNGCCAGNEFYEAFVQGISEIVERHHSIQIYKENFAMPRIPDTFWGQFEVVSSIMNQVRQEGKYEIDLLDCSMEQGFPVACAIFREKKSGKYGVRFGAHPNWEIAIERTLTEMFQGRDAIHAASLTNIVSDSEENYDLLHVFDLVKCGNGEIRGRFLDFDSDFKFIGETIFQKNIIAENGQPTRASAKNQSVANAAMQYFKELGFTIYIRDASYKEFSALQIIIPGFSEVFGDFKKERMQQLEDRDLCIQVLEALQKGDKVEEELIIRSATFLWDKLPMQQENTLSYTMNLPLKEDAARPIQNLKLMVSLFVAAEKYRTALELLQVLIRQSGDGNYNNEIRDIEKRLLHIIAGDVSVNSKTHEEIMQKCFDLFGFLCNQFQCTDCRHQKICDYAILKKYLVIPED